MRQSQPAFEVMNGGLSKEQSIGNQVRLCVEQLNKALEKAKEAGLDVGLYQRSSRNRISNAQVTKLEVRVRADV